MKDLKQIRICGLGGQGIILIGTILGQAAINDGKWVSGSNAYGSQARGGNARSEVVISKEPIAFPHVIQTDILVAFSQDVYEKFLLDVKSEVGVVLYENSLVTPKKAPLIKHFGISAINEAMHQLNNTQAANMIMLGAMASLTGIASIQSINQAICQKVPEKYQETNIKAVEIGRQLGEKNER